MLLSYTWPSCALASQINDFTLSFSDGRALCSIVHHYHPTLLRWELVQQQTTLTHAESNLLDADLRVGILRLEEMDVVCVFYFNTNSALSHPSAQMTVAAEGDMGYTATFSPGAGTLGGRTRQVLLSNEKHNFKLVAGAVSWPEVHVEGSSSFHSYAIHQTRSANWAACRSNSTHRT